MPQLPIPKELPSSKHQFWRLAGSWDLVIGDFLGIGSWELGVPFGYNAPVAFSGGSMTRRLCVLVLPVLALVVGLMPAAAAKAPAEITKSLFVTVLDQSGQPVKDMTAD